MAKNPKCWANVLDNCEGPLDGEHLVSVAIWAAALGRPNNRKGRLGRRVTLTGSQHLPDGEYKLDDVKTKILCKHHNSTTSPLDQEGGVFARAVEAWQTMVGVRSARRNRFVTWPQKTYLVDGPRFERLLLKLAINNAFLLNLPIGGEGVPPGWPTRELVEMVYGLRPIVRPAGLFALSKVGMTHAFGEETFRPIYFDNGRFIEGCVWMFRTFALGVQFTATELPASLVDPYPPLHGARPLPFNALDAGRLNVEVRLRW